MSRWQISFLSLFLFIGLAYQFYRKSAADKEYLPEETRLRIPTASSEKNPPSDSQNPQKNASPEKVQSSSLASVIRKMPEPHVSHKMATVFPAAHQLQKLKMKSLDEKWLWWGDVTSVSRDQFRSATETALAEIDQQIVVPNRSQASSPSEFYSETPLVLFDPQRQRVALLTGVYVVTAKSAEALSDLLKDGDFEVVNSFAHLQMAFLKPRKNPFNMNEVAAYLGQDGRVKTFEYEILKGNLVKN